MGIFTKIKNTLDPILFGNNQILHPHVRKRLLQSSYTIIPKEEINHLYVLGSSIGYRWESDSDIDINVILNQDSMGQKYWHQVIKQKNGQILLGSQHPVNYFVQDYFEQDFSESDFEVYDLSLNKWIHEPIPGSELPSPSTEKFDIAVADLYENKVRTIIENLKVAFEKWEREGDTNWYAEVIRLLDQLNDLFEEVDSDRKLVYNYSWGLPRYSIQNIIFKYLDKNDYIHILDKLHGAIK